MIIKQVLKPVENRGVQGVVYLSGNEEYLTFCSEYEAETIEDWYQLQRKDLLYGKGSTII
jgi:hypothetical protein